jgi:hypothetical protein
VSDGFTYEEREPSTAIRPWVRCLWTYARTEADSQPQPICADGCPELIFDLGPPHEERRGGGAVALQPEAMFVGQLTQPLWVQASGPTRVFAVRFEPDGAFEWLGRPIQTVTDTHLDLMALRPQWTQALLNALIEAPDPLSDLEAAITSDLAAAPRPDPRVRSAVEALHADLAVSLDRSGQRRFLKRVGVSARDLKAILRFRKVFDAIEADEGGGWVSAALSAGYFDQPQMARDFRRFLGCTATEWACQKAGLARAIVSQSYKPGTTGFA